MKVENMTGKNGRAIPNQFVIDCDNSGGLTTSSTYFQSYKSIIALKLSNYKGNKYQLDEVYWDYSRTTSKYRNMFLGMTSKEVKAKIKSGEIILTNLNK